MRREAIIHLTAGEMSYLVGLLLVAHAGMAWLFLRVAGDSPFDLKIAGVATAWPIGLAAGCGVVLVVFGLARMRKETALSSRAKGGMCPPQA